VSAHGPGWFVALGDCLANLKRLPDACAQTCVTSPPYYGLRDYSVEGQIGLEGSPDAYVARLVEVFAEVRRVLKPDGTLWLNLGDSYAGSGKGARGSSAVVGEAPRDMHNALAKESYIPGIDGKVYRQRTPAGLKAKDRIMIPARSALALQADGWWLRDEIIWHKPNPMPAPVTDRTVTAHEMVYLLAKSARYFFDHEAIKEAVAESTKRDSRIGTDRPADFDRRADQVGEGMSAARLTARNAVGGAETRNARSVWTITPKPFRGAHFATFPPDLAERCILAGSRPGDVVIDPFSGAGTTGVVATSLGRRYWGCELNPEYVEITRKRFAGEREIAVRGKNETTGDRTKAGFNARWRAMEMARSEIVR
jgi:DNA modification methylase